MTFSFYVLLTRRVSLHNLVNESNLVHDLFLVYFVNFIYTATCFRPLQVHHRINTVLPPDDGPGEARNMQRL
jgi:hypothetical protein